MFKAEFATIVSLKVPSGCFRERKLVWHGSNPWGERGGSTCRDWSSEDPLSFGLASDLQQGRLLGQVRAPCNHGLVVLCIETTGHTLYST